MTSSVIVGYGEVGRALHKVLGVAKWYNRSKGTWHNLFISKGTWHGELVDVAHICFPYSEEFDEMVKYWKIQSKLVIVHSSVPVGTCDKLEVVHSPIRGVHPYLEDGIRTFTKYFGGKEATAASHIFSDLGIKVKTYQKARITEAIKLWDTTQYGKLIMMEKEIYKWCKENKVSFNEVYQRANYDYNEGYVKLGRPEVVRPYLKHIKGEIGGHCVLNNAKLLKVKI